MEMCACFNVVMLRSKCQRTAFEKVDKISLAIKAAMKRLLVKRRGTVNFEQHNNNDDNFGLLCSSSYHLLYILIVWNNSYPNDIIRILPI